MSGSSLLGMAMWCRAAITEAWTSATVLSLSSLYFDGSFTPKLVSEMAGLSPRAPEAYSL